jgi:uncharacterized protein
MKTITTFIKRHPVLAYCAVVFGISWGGIFLLIGPGGVAVDADHLGALIGLGYVGMLAGPTVAGVLLMALCEGAAGLRDLRSRLLRWRVGGRWYAAGLLTAPLSILAVLLALSLVSPAYVPRLILEENRFGLLLFSVVAALLVGIFEEVGWTGFAVPVLRRRHGVVATGLIVGLLLAAWNFLIVYLREVSEPTPGMLPLVIYMAVGLLSWQVVYRVLLVWVYDRTGSLPVVMLMSTSLVAFWTMLTPLGLTRGMVVAYYLVLTAAWCAIIAVVALANQRRLARRPAVGAAA